MKLNKLLIKIHLKRRILTKVYQNLLQKDKIALLNKLMKVQNKPLISQKLLKKVTLNLISLISKQIQLKTKSQILMNSNIYLVIKMKLAKSKKIVNKKNNNKRLMKSPLNSNLFTYLRIKSKWIKRLKSRKRAYFPMKLSILLMLSNYSTKTTKAMSHKRISKTQL